MSTGEEDRIARSVALEKTYVHDVYDHMSALQYPEHRNTTPWPKVKKFLNELEPGSIVCDVGCGNGKYLKVNPSIFKIGSDRCHKLTQIAKDDDNEVLLCDNLTLPFRDETFDAVLSIAVIHHFATKERRVGALKELARVLRIGGRLMITVWAMEQKERKFETQDVLVQWHHPQFYRSPSLEFSTTATTTSEEDFATPYRISQTQVSDDTDSIFSRSSSLMQDSRPGRSRLRLFQSLRSIKTSPSSSSLSSPNETCYSFVRKALQKLSRSNKKEKHRSRAWFLDSWASFGKDDHLPATRYDPEGCEENTDIQDLPIELRRMEKENSLAANRGNSSSLHLLEINLTQKSKSLNDILSQATSLPSPITRSRSSIVTADGFKIKIKTAVPATTSVPVVSAAAFASTSAFTTFNTIANEAAVATTSATTTTTTTTTTTSTTAANTVITTAAAAAAAIEIDNLKPKLVKQKKSICEEEFEFDDEERDKATDMRRLVKELPVFKVSMEKPEKFNVFKQKSLTEDIMSADRLKEKEKVRQNIQKQASLNEDLIYRRQRTLDSFKDTFLTSSSKKFQMFRSGLTSKLKSSTTNIEKVTGVSIKSGFVKIFQGLTGGETVSQATAAAVDMATPSAQPVSIPTGIRKSSSEDRGDDFPVERRCSHEENSDSSKDNSLQSDTSVDSEDSIISVIERVIPKSEQSSSPTKLTSPGPHSPKMMLTGVLSHPSSPKISQVMQYPTPKAKAFSLPASPRTIVLSPNIKQTFKIPPPIAHISSGNISNGNGIHHAKLAATDSTNGSSMTSSSATLRSLTDEEQSPPVLKLTPIKQITAAKMKAFGDKEMLLLSEKLTVLCTKETEPRGDVCEGDESQKSNIEQPLLQSKDNFKKSEELRSKSSSSAIAAVSSGRSTISGQFGKKASKGGGPHSSTYLTHQSRLQSYELFNPETEDIDTDSSGVSTPDSVGSVISVKIESSNGTPVTEIAGMEICEFEETGIKNCAETLKECSISSLPSTSKASAKLEKLVLISDNGLTTKTTAAVEESRASSSAIEQSGCSLLEAALYVASSLETTVGEALKRRNDHHGEEEASSSAAYAVLVAAAATTTSATTTTEVKDTRSREKLLRKYPSLSKSPECETWDKECRQYIVDLAENLSERLLAEIDRYKEQSNVNVEKEFANFSATDLDDPYLCKLSEELHHVSKLTKELSEDLETESTELEMEVDTDAEKITETEQLTTEIKRTDSLDEISDNLITIEEYALNEENITEVEDDDEAVEIEDAKMEEEDSVDVERRVKDGYDHVEEEKEPPSLLDSESAIDGEMGFKGPLISDLSAEADSPGSITGWLDSRRNTIESGFFREPSSVLQQQQKQQQQQPPTTTNTATAAAAVPENIFSIAGKLKKEEQQQMAETTDFEEGQRLSVSSQPCERVRKLSKSETASQTRLSIESTDTVDVSERTVSSSEDSSISKRDTTQTETSSGLSIESDLCELDKSSVGGDTASSKSTDYACRHEVADIKYSGSQVSLLRPGESIESSDAGDFSERTGSVSDFSRQNTESRSVITQSSASLASWSDCSKDIRFADRRTARCDGRSSSEETNPRAMLTRQEAAIQEPSEAKIQSSDTSLSGSTSQDSLTSESGGGSIMFHRYYHVFREGELDALIDEFVENLHIISSYYDHTNWCIIAEKVRVWTI